MLVVLAFDKKEIDLTNKLARWIADLGGVSQHDILIVPSLRTHRENLADSVVETLSSAFNRTSILRPMGEDEFGWPDSANFAWRQTVQFVEDMMDNQPFLWIEPDSVPLSPVWLDSIAMEYRLGGKPFMGQRVTYTGVPEHLTGISVYHRVRANLPNYAVVQYQRGYAPPQVAWDVSLAPQMLANAHFTDLIQHEWKADPFLDAESLDRLRPGAAIYHQCKDGSLIDRLREKLGISEGVAPKSLDVDKIRSEVLGSKVLSRGIQNKILEQLDGKKTSPIYPSNTVFTYFQPVENIDETEQRLLIDLWKFSWRNCGWNPVVLSGPVSGPIYEAFSALPSVNPEGYDLACFCRWLAVAEAGGGWMCDYDVMNRSFKPRDVPARLTVYQTENACPSLVGGSAGEFLRIATVMAERGNSLAVTEHGGLHVSDMHVLQGLPDEYDQDQKVTAYGNKGWGMARAVHFANQTMEGKKPRSKWIPHLMWARDPK